MSHNSQTALIHANIAEYKRKFYLNQLLKGSILSLIIIAAYLTIILLSEGLFWFSTSVRTGIFFLTLALVLIVIYKFLLNPILYLYIKRRQISDEKAAKLIGSFFPEVRDHLLNILQLEKISATNAMAAASIEKKAPELQNITFSNSIDISKSFKFIKYLAIPFGIMALVLIVHPKTIIGSTQRIISYKTEFEKEAPFKFVIDPSQQFHAFRNEDLTVKMNIDGLFIPEDVIMETSSREIILQPSEGSSFEYTFSNLNKNQTFRFSSAGYKSREYQILVIERPILQAFDVKINYPHYTGLEDKVFSSISQLVVPEGTQTEWNFYTAFTDSMWVTHQSEKSSLNQKEGTFQYQQQVSTESSFEVRLQNKYGENRDKILFEIKTIEDIFPEIDLYQIQDTVLYQSILLGGKLTDDYGIKKLSIYYKLQDQSEYEELKIPLESRSNNVSFVHDWQLAKTGFSQGSELEYYLQVWDNDQVNGAKSSKTPVYQFKIPTKEEIKEQISQEASNTAKSTKEAQKKSKELNREIKAIADEIKSKQKLEWQDKKRIQELVEEKKKVQAELDKLSKEHEQYMEKRETFNKYDEDIKEKYDQLQELMEQLLDDETKKLYEKMEQLLQENTRIEEMKEMLEKLDSKEQNLSKELERSLELFKQMQVDMKMEDIKNDLSELAEKQEQLSEETESQQSSNEELQEKQNKINDEYEQIQKQMQDLDSLNSNLKNERNLDEIDQSDEDIEESLQKSSQELQKKNNKAASKQQKKAGKQMKQMSQKIAESQASSEMEMLNENIGDLKNLLDNLLKLSQEQEEIMIKMRTVKEVDPTFVDLSQRQLTLEGNTKIVKDSLYALAERVVQLNSFVTKEVAKMDEYMTKTISEMRQRLIPQTAARQQLTMTSMNNLALLLDSLLKQMMAQMNAMSGSGKGQKKDKKGSNKDQQEGQIPNISQLQKQLNQQIQQLKNGQKQGRQMSEGLAKMAAEQERLRRMLKQMEQMMEGGEKGNGGLEALKQLEKEMEKTEEDLVNKRLNNQLIQRQNRIETRLLEAENAMREREFDKQREAESAKQQEKTLPPSFEEYFKQKEKEIELLKTVPLKLSPFYKREVEHYFDRLGKSKPNEFNQN